MAYSAIRFTKASIAFIAVLAMTFCLASVGHANAASLTAQASKVATPAKVTISSTKSPKARQVIVKVSKAKNAKGYQYVISQSKKFAGSTTVEAKTAKRSYTFEGLAQGKRYYVKVRSYNRKGRTTKWGKWSAVKHVTVEGASSSEPSAPTAPTAPNTAEEEFVQLQLFVINRSAIDSIADIEPQERVHIGVWAEQAITVARILKSSGLSGSNVSMMPYGNVADVAASLQSGQSDVMAVMDACPIPLLAYYPDFRAIGLSSEQVRSITAADSNCTSYTISANTYANQSEPLLTVTGKAVKPPAAGYPDHPATGFDIF